MVEFPTQPSEDLRTNSLNSIISHFNFDNYFPEDRAQKMLAIQKTLDDPKKQPKNPPVYKLQANLNTNEISSEKIRCIRVLARDEGGQNIVNDKYALDAFAIRMKNALPETRNMNNTDVLIPYQRMDENMQEHFCYLSMNIDDYDRLCTQVSDHFTSQTVYNQ